MSGEKSIMSTATDRPPSRLLLTAQKGKLPADYPAGSTSIGLTPSRFSTMWRSGRQCHPYWGQAQ